VEHLELSLFSGSGGGLLGTKLLGFRHIGYVEWNEHCQRVIKQRIVDGLLDDAPIFGDIGSFIAAYVSWSIVVICFYGT
jgi:DNA (cytosine-5)-methyltransferase 1